MTYQEAVARLDKLNRKFEKAICCLQNSALTGVQFQDEGVDLASPGDVNTINFTGGVDATYFGGILTVDVPALRFGIEDNVAGELRVFELPGATKFQFLDSAGLELNTEILNANTFTRITLAAWPGTLGNDSVNQILLESYKYGSGHFISVKSAGDIVNDDSVELYLQPGTMQVNLAANSQLVVNGLDPDNTVTDILGIDAFGKVVTVSKGSIASQYFHLAADYSDPGGDSGMIDIVGLTTTLDANSTYEVELHLILVENGTSGTQFLLETDSLPAFGNITYEIVAGTATLPGAVHGTDFGGENWASIFIPAVTAYGYSDRYLLRVTGTIITNLIPIVIQAQMGNYGGLGDTIANAGSFLKVTKIA